MSAITHKLTRSFYNQDTLKVAQALLGARLVHCSSQGVTSGEIVETEAYIGPKDAASHAFGGRRTPRTAIQFGLGGYAYVYVIYGVHHCLCIVTEPENRPGVVLVRALRPVSGLDLMVKRRNLSLNGQSFSRAQEILRLCNGPAKLCQAMGISKDVHYGIDLCGNVLYIEAGRTVAPEDIAATKRINIGYAGEAKQYLWRYCIYDCNFVSQPVRRQSVAQL
jgi:DNA-3-methyladenine glycosylase